jgi:hypothetical protein
MLKSKIKKYSQSAIIFTFSNYILMIFFEDSTILTRSNWNMIWVGICAHLSWHPLTTTVPTELLKDTRALQSWYCVTFNCKNLKPNPFFFVSIRHHIIKYLLSPLFERRDMRVPEKNAILGGNRNQVLSHLRRVCYRCATAHPLNKLIT